MSDLTPRTWKVPETELFSVPLPRETRTYKPVSHRELADVTMDAIHKSGFILDRQSYSSAKDGNVANGRFTIKNVADSEMQLQIGWQNSYDKSLSLKFAIGTRILVCANGCVSGDFGSFKKKHVGEVATFAPAAIMEYIKKAGEAFTRMQVQRDAMKEIEVSKQVQAELIGRMFIEKNIIKSTQLNIIKDELRHATHDYKAEGSLWELYNFTTFALKETHPANWMRDHINAHDFFVSSTGLLLPRTHADEPMSPPGSPYEMAAEAMDVIDAEIIH